MITKSEFYIYRKILYIIDNCCVVEEDSTQITVEICLDEHRHLLEDLTNKFFIKKLGTRKTKTKIGHAYVVGDHFLTIKICKKNFKMVFDVNNGDIFPFDKPRKLKHLTLSHIFYQLLNTSYIFTYNSFLYCSCDKFQGCHSKLVNGMIADRNFCYVCRVKVTYDEEKNS